MSKHPKKVIFCRMHGIEVVEKRGWVRNARSQAKEKFSEEMYKSFMKHIG